MPGLVAVTCRADIASFTGFYSCLNELKMPEGSSKKLFPGFFAHENKQRAIKEVLDKDLDWVFFLDDDFLFHPDVLNRLLAHDKEVITGPSLYRRPPFNPYLFRAADEAGHITEAELPSGYQGLIRVAGCGGSGLLIKRSVLEILGPKCFDVDDFYKTDDLYFCSQANKAGIEMWCDLSIPFGHTVIASVWPEYKNGNWSTAVVINNEIKLDVPAATFVNGVMIIPNGEPVV